MDVGWRTWVEGLSVGCGLVVNLRVGHWGLQLLALKWLVYSSLCEPRAAKGEHAVSVRC